MPDLGYQRIAVRNSRIDEWNCGSSKGMRGGQKPAVAIGERTCKTPKKEHKNIAWRIPMNRKAHAKMATLGVSMFLLFHGCGGPIVGTSCENDKTECAYGCFDFNLDERHCGMCDNSCLEEEVCLMGTCGICPDGTKECLGKCLDLSNDEQNCGECDYVCLEDEICISSTCEIDCGDGLIECNEECVDPSTDRDHCGRCNTPCTELEICQGQRCIKSFSL
jgi:hypothetical protein